MLNVNAFDELGRILASGGEQRLIVQAAGGMPLVSLAVFARERYSQLSNDDSITLAELAIDAVRAGGMITADLADQSEPYRSAPRNPLLCGVDSMGTRYRVTAISSTYNPATGEHQLLRHAVNLGESIDYDELIRQIEEAIRKIEEKYPERFKGKLDSENGISTVMIESIQARY